MPEINKSKYLVQAGWNDVPHLDEDVKADLLANTPRHLRDARSKGTPSLGAGAIYPHEYEAIACDPFPIPPYFAKGYGMDVGWERTAAIFGAHDRDNDVIYLYSEHYGSQEQPSIHADAIKARGEWLIGACDYAGGDQTSGQRTIEVYQALGLHVVPAKKAVDAGILEVDQRLASGRLKVFRTCQNWFNEQRLYRRDEKGKIVKKHDHLMDATRYLIADILNIMRTRPVPLQPTQTFHVADKLAGY